MFYTAKQSDNLGVMKLIADRKLNQILVMSQLALVAL
jgi:hypothetical protein